MVERIYKNEKNIKDNEYRLFTNHNIDKMNLKVPDTRLKITNNYNSEEEELNKQLKYVNDEKINKIPKLLSEMPNDLHAGLITTSLNSNQYKNPHQQTFEILGQLYNKFSFNEIPKINDLSNYELKFYCKERLEQIMTSIIRLNLNVVKEKGEINFDFKVRETDYLDQDDAIILLMSRCLRGTLLLFEFCRTYTGETLINRFKEVLTNQNSYCNLCKFRYTTNKEDHIILQHLIPIKRLYARFCCPFCFDLPNEPFNIDTFYEHSVSNCLYGDTFKLEQIEKFRETLNEILDFNVTLQIHLSYINNLREKNFMLLKEMSRNVYEMRINGLVNALLVKEIINTDIFKEENEFIFGLTHCFVDSCLRSLLPNNIIKKISHFIKKHPMHALCIAQCGINFWGGNIKNEKHFQEFHCFYFFE